MNAVNTDLYAGDFRRLESSLPGRDAPWLGRLRRDALAWFLDRGLPGPRDEAWKYTDLKALAKHGLRPAAPGPGEAGTVDERVLQPHLLVGAYRLVFVDGRLNPRLSDVERLPKGVTVSSLAAALEERPGALEAVLGRHAAHDANGFAALNTALFADGAYVHIGRNIELERPIQLVYLSTGLSTGNSAEDGAAAHLRNVVVADSGSRAVVIESYAAGIETGAYATNALTEVVLEDNASVEHYKLQREAEQSFHVAGLHVHQGRDSRYTGHNVALGSRLARSDLHAVLDAEGAECHLNGLNLTHGRQHVDNHLVVEHRRPHGTSRQWYKGVLDGRSRTVFSGRVIVSPDAQHTDAEQRNNNLLLSEHAEADSRPQLEIYADDVKCSHGATVGQ
ncbi:MAG: SufD family Fe-S cluster assembly protein, partial [Gammaproteobacteria bacterium]